MKILITGASGLIGTALSQSLTEQGHQVEYLNRQSPTPPCWYNNRIDLGKKTFDAIVHLAGEPIGNERWSAKKKNQIINSRKKGTTLLIDAFRDNPPAVFICASAIGFYGHRGETILDENSPKGSDFVSDVASTWELAADTAKDCTRVVKIRTGLVLSKKGGALAQMLPFFKLGVGGKVGGAQQYWSWITLADEIRAIEFLIEQKQLSGVFNLTAPNPVNNAVFTKALGKALNRPTLLSTPELAIKLKFGDMAKELLLSSTRVLPNRLLAAGFVFKDNDIEKTLQKEFTSD